MKDARDLKVYQKAEDLCVAVEATLDTFPAKQKYNLIDQIRRASTSIVANIAEGNGVQYPKKEKDFYDIAVGSACEVQALLHLSSRLHYVSNDSFEEFDQALWEIRRMLTALIKKLSES
ncbi:four helix bundle protein [Alkalibacillus salilacus]|uniref:Four helix bundle protein n=1 Tax=Alkalibacillus salilacus TaxID=284582 RepID=A0ABT9VIE1_9BACI|nr:four helix bundle protein [Alkalibacillus salilacus]MDQ0160737.1 four helix bundle protein [Alkalibacillus salilacus]